jgi:prophage tail gpP-like protein
MFENEVAVSIGGLRFRYWSKIRIERAIDNLDTVELDSPFDPSDLYLRSVFRPFEYSPITISVNDDTFFTGVVVQTPPILSATSNTVSIGAYSSPGVLGECPPPITVLPLEFKKQNLHEIARTLVEPFKIEIVADIDPGPAFDKVAKKPNEAVLRFVASLAKQRNQVMGSDETGALVFRQAIESGPTVALLKQGASPLIGITPTFNPSQYYSEITGIQPVRVRSKKSVKFTVRNTLLPNVTRPFIFDVPNSKDGDIETAVKAKMSRMYANMVSYSVDVATWRDPQDKLWAPNTMISVEAPGAMIYKPSIFLIRSVTYRRDEKTETASLDLVLPGSFTEVQPGGFPWDE